MVLKWKIIGLVLGIALFAVMLSAGIAWYWAVLAGIAAFAATRDDVRAYLAMRRK